MWHLRIYMNDQVHGGCVVDKVFNTEALAKVAQSSINDDGVEFTCPSTGGRIWIPTVRIHHVFRWDDAVITVPDPPGGMIIST